MTTIIGGDNLGRLSGNFEAEKPQPFDPRHCINFPVLVYKAGNQTLVGEVPAFCLLVTRL